MDKALIRLQKLYNDTKVRKKVSILLKIAIAEQRKDLFGGRHIMHPHQMRAALDAKRDLKFGYLGLQILYDRYFLHVRGERIELPQTFFMRVAMGLALNEPESQREARAIEFYNALSSFDVMSSTPKIGRAHV